jgi:hypothetical protein
MKSFGEIAKENSKKYTKRPRYTVVLHEVREKLDLSFNSYAVLDSIHKLSHSDPNYFYCTMSKDKIAEFLSLSRRTIFHAIEEGLKKNLLEKNDRGDLRTTQKWVDMVELYSFKEQKNP